MNTLRYNEKGVSPRSGAYVAPHTESQRRTKFYVPRSLDLETMIIDAGFLDWLEPARIEKLLWVVSKICEEWHVNGTTKVGCFVNIPSELIRKKLHWRFAREAVEVLTALGIVETNAKYSAREGGFSKSFRLAKEFWNEPVVIIDGKVKTAKDESVIQNPEQRWIFESLRLTEFDEASFRATIAPQMPANRLLRAERSIDRLQAKIFNLRGGKAQRRVTHTISQCPRELRAFLSIAGDRLADLDIKSSQPVLLLSLYDDTTCEEAKRFKEALRSGIYGALSSADKETAKEQFGKFISPKHWRKNEFGVNFAKRFPILNDKIRSFPGSLAAHLQDVEAGIVIYGVVPKLRERGIPFVSIHDGGLCRPAEAATVAALLREEVTKCVGFEPFVTVQRPTVQC